MMAEPYSVNVPILVGRVAEIHFTKNAEYNTFKLFFYKNGFGFKLFHEFFTTKHDLSLNIGYGIAIPYENNIKINQIVFSR